MIDFLVTDSLITTTHPPSGAKIRLRAFIPWGEQTSKLLQGEGTVALFGTEPFVQGVVRCERNYAFSSVASSS